MAEARSGADVDHGADEIRRRRNDMLYDNIELSWARERPDLDLRMVATMLRLEGVFHLHEQRLQRIAKTIGLNLGDLYVLLALRRAGEPYEMRPTELYQALLITSGAMSKRMARLHDAGYVTRVSAVDDGRSELVRLTAAGTEVTERAISLISAVVRHVTSESRLSAREMKQLDNCLRKLLNVKARSEPLETLLTPGAHAGGPEETR